MNTLTENIKQWAVARDLHSADPHKQVLKLGEEFGELCAAMARDDHKEKIDAIGDMYVVLTILSMQLDTNVEDNIRHAYNEIKDRKGKMVDGIYVKEEDLRYKLLQYQESYQQQTKSLQHLKDIT